VDTGGALSGPRGVAVDRAGNLYIADTGNHRVRRVSPGALVTTIAGNGACCYSGDGGLALSAMLNQPWAVAVDAGGNVYVTDAGNNAVRMLAPVSAGTTVSAVTNAASNLPGAVAPGELVVLYGAGLGGVRTVLFNGVAGPLLYAAPGQVGAVVPYAVGAGSVQAVVQSAGAASAPVAVALTPTAPGLFTADGSGLGQAAAVNQDGTRNGTAAPAAAGSVLSLYATGRKIGYGAAAAAGGPSHREDRWRGRRGALRGRRCRPDRRCDAGQRGGARRVGGWRRSRGVNRGRSAKPAGRDGGGSVSRQGLTGHTKRWPVLRAIRDSDVKERNASEERSLTVAARIGALLT